MIPKDLLLDHSKKSYKSISINILDKKLVKGLLSSYYFQYLPFLMKIKIYHADTTREYYSEYYTVEPDCMKCRLCLFWTFWAALIIALVFFIVAYWDNEISEFSKCSTVLVQVQFYCGEKVCKKYFFLYYNN